VHARALEAEGSVVQIGLFLISSKNAFQGHQREAALSASRSAGLTVDVFYAENDSRVQREQMFAYLRRTPAPAGVVVAPVDDSGLRFVAQEAARNGVAWSMLNRTPPWLEETGRECKGLCFAVAADQPAIGRIQAEQYRALLPKGGTVLYVTGPLATQATHQRMTWMESAKGALISVIKLFGDWTQDGGYAAVKGWLETTRGLVPFDLLGSQNDDMALGGLKAAAEMAEPLGKPGLRSICATGVDGVPEFGQRWVKEKKLLATVIVPTTAGTAVELLAAALRDGVTPPSVTLLEVTSSPQVTELRPLSLGR
jgi:ABC-type sugar transport system substrate-binding protein